MTAQSIGHGTRKAPSRAEQKLREFHEEGAIGKAYDARLVRRLLPYVLPHRRFLVISLGTLVLMTATNLYRPILMGDIVTQASAARADLLLRDGVGLGLLLVLVQSMTFAQMYTMQIAGARAMADLRAHIFHFLQSLELRYFDRTPVGRLVTRATNDVDAVGELFASGVLNATGDLLALSGIVVMMLVLDWRLSLIAFAALPIVGIVVNFVRKRSRAAYRDIRTKTARLNSFLNEQVNGIAVVQAYAREAAEARGFDEINLAYLEANKRSIYYEAFLDAAIEMVGTVCIASILWWAGLHALPHVAGQTAPAGETTLGVGAHAVTFGKVVVFTQYIKQFFEPISMLSTRYTVLQSAMAGAERIFQLLDVTERDSPALARNECAPDGPPDEAICLKDVWFEYKKDTPVLRDVNLVARKGERIALVGATGAGKTTVSAVILRLYESKSGVVRVLGKDVRSYDRHALRENFSVVPQEVFLFSGTVLSNVAMSDPSPDRDKALRALGRIGALEVFMRRDGGLDAPVDERGSNFSAGERQLLAFARAIYRDAPLLILDEATSSVDSDTEARLQRALEAVMEGRTSLVIAHRLSTIRAADRIVVFHKGRVVEIGSHDELMAKDGVYARLHRLQFAQERVAEMEAAAQN